MSDHVEWASAKGPVEVINDPEWADPYGTQIEEGNIGVWLSESVLIEGTPREIRDLGQRLIDLGTQVEE